MRTFYFYLSAFALALSCGNAFAQASLLQAGPTTPGHVPQYSSSGTMQPTITDGGGAAGGDVGVNPGEIGVTARTSPGTGPLGEHVCIYDEPITNVGGGHFLCLDPNAQGGGLLDYGSFGGATPLPFQISVNGSPLFWGAQTPVAIDPRSPPYNAKCDGAANDQLGMQSALTVAEANGAALLVPGQCVVSGLSVTTPVLFQGSGDRSQIILASGSTAPAISVSIPSTAPGVLGGWANVTLQNVTITSPNRTDANHTLEHGIAVADGSPAVVTVVNLINSSITGIPGHAIYATAHSGYFNLINSNILLPGQAGFYCNSSTDSVLNGGVIYGALTNNIILSSCTNTKITNVNEFDAVGSGVVVYHSSDVVFDNDTLDIAGQNSLDIINNANQTVTVLGGLIRWSGTTANNTYYDLLSDAGNAGVTTLFGTHFQTPASSTSSNKPAGNVGFSNPSSASVNCFNCAFDLGPIGTAGITNSVTQQLFSGTSQPMTVNSAKQYVGLSGFNGTNNTWQLIGTSVDNDNGALILYGNGSAGTILNAYALSTIAQLGTPALRSGFANNTDLTGRVTLSGGTATYTLYTGVYSSAPNCWTQDVTTPTNSSYAVEGTTSVVFHGTGTDVIKYHCIGTN